MPFILGAALASQLILLMHFSCPFFDALFLSILLMHFSCPFLADEDARPSVILPMAGLVNSHDFRWPGLTGTVFGSRPGGQTQDTIQLRP